MFERVRRYVVMSIASIGLVFLIVISVWSHRDLLGVDIMEARNLITAREMIETGHWLLPTMHGEPRLAKPPLPTWFTAWAMEIGNSGLDTDLSVDRIPSALSGLFLLFSFYGLTRFWTRSSAAAGWSTAFLATSYMFLLMGRRNSWDIYCHSFMLAAIWVLAVILDAGGPRRLLAVLAGILMGLSGLCKGPVSYYALLLPFFLAFVLSGAWRKMFAHKFELALALGIGLVVSVSWPIGAWMSMPHDFFRMLRTEESAWFVEHTKPFWFYLQFPLMTGVWVLMSLAVLWPDLARIRIERFMPYWRGLIWTLACVGLLMLFPEKKDRYLLPVLIPLCMMMGTFLAGLVRDQEPRRAAVKFLLWANSIVFCLLCIGLPVALWVFRSRFPALDMQQTALLSGAGLLFAGLIFLLCRSGEIVALFVTKLCFLGIALVGLPLILQPRAGDMSVPLNKIRAFAAVSPVYADSSLKFQDYWIVGTKPVRLIQSAPQELPDHICVVSREENASSVLPEYERKQQLVVSDLSGQSMYLLELQKR